MGRQRREAVGGSGRPGDVPFPACTSGHSFLVSAMGSPHKGAARAVPLSGQRNGSVLFCAFSPTNPKSWCGFVCSEIFHFIVA